MSKKKYRKVFKFFLLGFPFILASCSSNVANVNKQQSTREEITNLNNFNPNEIPESRIREFDSNLESVAPKGQTFVRVNDKNERIVEDQYEFDNPKNEKIFYYSKGFPGSVIVNNKKLDNVKVNKEEFVAPDKKILQTLNSYAKNAGQPYYENAQQRVFSLPSYDKDGKPNGLVINNYEQGFTSPSFWGESYSEGGPGRVGLPRIIPNKDYLDLAKSSIGLTILNGRGINASGTGNLSLHGSMSIIDYQIKSDNSYPTTWYFLTNAHVADNLRLKDDNKDPNKIYGRDYASYNEKDTTNNTVDVSLTKLKQDTPLKSKIPTTIGPDFKNYFDSVSVDVDKVKTIVIGTNPFNWSPKTFSNQKEYQDVEELLDFAVIEITFKNEQDARLITQNYFDDKNVHFKVNDSNLLNDEEYKKFPIKNFYALGWPLSNGESSYTLNEFEDKENFKVRKSAKSVWVNKPTRLFKTTNEEDDAYPDGGEFSWSRSYRSFVNKPGLTDFLISTPVLSSNLFKIEEYDSNKGEFTYRNYLISGQGTILDNLSAAGGISGTSIRLKDKSTYSLLFAGDGRASSSITLNLRSYGYDYKGYYGKYNLPAYDIIYGSVNQRKSYWDAMNKLYGSKNEIKTNLFKDGFGNNSKVDVFKDKTYVKINV